MLIVDKNSATNPLPVYEVQEVSMKEALALLTSAQRAAADPLTKPYESGMPLINGVSPELQVMGHTAL